MTEQQKRTAALDEAGRKQYVKEATAKAGYPAGDGSAWDNWPASKKAPYIQRAKADA